MEDFKRMQKLAGLPENTNTDKKQLDENFVGTPMIGQIFNREKTDYEMAFEHYMGEAVEEESEEENKLDVVIKFELDNNTSSFGEASPGADSLHEALSQAIHEGNQDALDWLSDNVLDIH